MKFLFLKLANTLNKDEIFSILIQYFNMFLNFLNLFLITKLYGFTILGIYVKYMMLQQMGGLLFTAGLSNYSIKYLSGRSTYNNFFNLIFKHLIFVLFIIVIIVKLFSLSNGQFSQTSNYVVVLIWLGVIRYFIEDILIGLSLNKKSSLVSTIESSIRIIAPLFINIEKEIACIALLSASSMIAIYIGYTFIKNSFVLIYKNKIKFKYFIGLYISSLSIFMSHLMNALQGKIIILVASLYFNSYLVGVLASLLMWADIVLRLGIVVGRLIFYRSSKRQKNTNAVHLASFVNAIGFLSVIMSCFLSLSFVFLSKILYEERLTDYNNAFFLLSIYTSSFLYFSLTNNFLNGLGLSKIVSKRSIIYLVLSFILINIACMLGSIYVLSLFMAIIGLIFSYLSFSSLKQYNTK